MMMSKKIGVCFLLALSFVLVSGFSFVSANDWPMLGGGPERQGWANSFFPDYSNGSGYDSDGLIVPLEILGEGSDGGLIVADGVLYAQTYNKVLAYNLSSSTLLWSHPTQFSFGTPSVASGSVCYGEAHVVACRDSSTGSLTWNYTQNDLFFNTFSPLIKDGSVWIGSSGMDPGLYQFDLSTGDVLSKYEPTLAAEFGGTQQVNSATIFDGVVYVTTVGGNGWTGGIYAIDESDGLTEVWKYESVGQAGAFWYGAPTISGEKVFAGSEGGYDFDNFPAYLIALNKNDGSVLWKYDVPDTNFVIERSMPSLYAGKVIFSATTDFGPNDQTYVYALDEDTGSLVWKSGLLSSGLWGTPSVADSKISLGTVSELFTFDSNDGSTVWSNSFASDHYGFSSIVSNVVYVSDIDGSANSYDSQIKHTEPFEGIVAGVGPGGNIEYTIDAKAAADIEIDVVVIPDFVPPEGANMTITQYLDADDLDLDEGTIKTENGTVRLNKFVDVDFEGVSADEVNFVLEEATIRMYYTDDEVMSAGILDESLLRLYVWDLDVENWTELDNSGVNVAENFVYGTTDHFSEFGGGSIQMDSDGDGAFDVDDNCVNVQNENQSDVDGDEIGDLCDNCMGVQNGNQADFDQDGLGDLCDGDMDDDGIDNDGDVCPLDPEASQEDRDDDGVGDDCDNCLDVENEDQFDTDADGLGDACDDDDDGDGFLDEEDNCPLIFTLAPMLDFDGDTYGDGCDECPFTFGDVNNDGSIDVQDLTAVILAWGSDDVFADINNDGTVDVQDLVEVVINWGVCGGGGAGPGAGSAQTAIPQEVTELIRRELGAEAYREFIDVHRDTDRTSDGKNRPKKIKYKVYSYSNPVGDRLDKNEVEYDIFVYDLIEMEKIVEPELSTGEEVKERERKVEESNAKSLTGTGLVTLLSNSFLKKKSLFLGLSL